MACANIGSSVHCKISFFNHAHFSLSSILCFRWKFWNEIFITVILNGCLLLFISYSKAHSMMDREREREKLRPWRITGEHCLFTFCAHEPRRTSKRDTPERMTFVESTNSLLYIPFFNRFFCFLHLPAKCELALVPSFSVRIFHWAVCEH